MAPRLPHDKVCDRGTGSKVMLCPQALPGLRGFQKRVQIGLARRTSAPWYGFQLNLAIAARVSIAGPSTRRVKRPGTNGRGELGRVLRI